MQQREIKFRAWDTKGKEMVNDIHIAPEYGWLVLADNDAMAERERPEQGQWILMQDTGLKDKKGKKIYEGDIVEWGDGWSRGDVYWKDEEAGWWHHNLEPANPGFVGMSKRLWDDVEVIGNIYENPELLQQ